MELINPILFSSEVLAAEEQFAAIAKMIRKYAGNAESDRFIQAYKNIDVNTTVAMLDQLVTSIIGNQDTTDALYHFVEKFPTLNPELYGAVAAESFEYRKVTAIDGFYDRMKRIMEGK